MRIEGGGTTADRYSLAVFNAAGEEAFRVNANKRVGIGTMIPATKLHIFDSSADPYLKIGGSGRDCGIQLDAGTNFTAFRTDAANRLFVNAGADAIRFSVGGTGSEKARIDSSGRTLIGTITQYNNARLQVTTTNQVVATFEGTGVSDPQIYVGDNMASPTDNCIILGYDKADNRGYLTVGGDGDDVFTVTNGGNVGISSAIPVNKLDVNGNVAVNHGTFYVKSDVDAMSYQVLSGYKTFSDSETLVGLAYVGHSHSISVQYMIIENNNTALGGAHGRFDVFTTYGNGTIYNHTFRRNAMNGGRINGDPHFEYCNGGCGSHGNNYVLRARVAYTGTDDNFTIRYVIKGLSIGNMYC